MTVVNNDFLRQRIVGIAAVCVLVASRTHADPPDVNFLFPSGLAQGTTRTLRVDGKPGSTPVHVWSSTDGLTVEPDEKGEELAVTAAADAPPGTHWLRVFNDEGASQLLPVIVGVIPETTEDDFPQDAAAEESALPVTISGALSRNGQVDAYPVFLKSEQTFIASIDAHRSLGAPADIVLQLVSAAGFVLDQNDDFHGLDPQIVHTAQQSGNYTVRLFAFPAEPDRSIRFSGDDEYVYRLTLTTGPFIDHSVPLSLPQGDAVNVRYVGWNIPEEHRQLRLPADPSWPLACFPFPASVALNHIPRVAHPIAVEESLPPREAGRTLSFGSAVTGHIFQPAEVDSYAFDAQKDQELEITVAARSFGSPLDPVLRLLDAGGKLIEEGDDISRENVDVELDVGIPTDGRYFAEVADRYGHGGMRYVYELRIVQKQPRFTLTVQDDRFTMKDGKPVEIPVSIDRDRELSEEITVTVRGLPEGVSADPVASTRSSEGSRRSRRSRRRDSSDEVTLKLEGKAAAGFRGPIEIIGSSPEMAEVIATTRAPGVSMTTTSIWLTVPPAPADEEDASANSPQE